MKTVKIRNEIGKGLLVLTVMILVVIISYPGLNEIGAAIRWFRF